MLVITRKKGESVTLNGDITVTVLRSGNEVKLAIGAPKEVTIVRSELLESKTDCENLSRM